MIHTGFHVSRATQGLALHAHRLRIRGFHPLRPDFPVRSAHLVHGFWRPYYPTHALRHAWFGLFPVRSPLLGESLLFSLPAGTKMFQFPAFAFRIERNAVPSRRRVVPFGDPRITGRTYTRLFAAYHVLLRLQEPRHPPYALSFCFYVTHTPRYIRTKWHIYFRLYSVPPLKVGTPSLLLSLVQNVIDLLSLYPRTPQTSNGRERILVENNGFEPLTLCLQSRCSSQLS